MTKYGLIGYSLGHSFSKNFFDEKFRREGISDNSYSLFPLETIQSFPQLIANKPELRGLNVTIPYKESVIPYLHELDDTAKVIGAVNCIKITRGNLKGYNTDTLAFEKSLKRFLPRLPQQTFVLGTGGSAKAVAYALRLMNISYLKVSRTPTNDEIAYSDIAANMKQVNLFVNTTPLGMFPEVGGYVDLPYQLLTSRDFLFDLVYNPGETNFLRLGKERGASIENGLEMLQLQAELSWEIWNN